MDFTELREKFKSMPIWARLGLAACGACLMVFAVYSFYFDVSALEEQLNTSKTEEDAARTKFENARSQKSKIPKLEEELKFTEDQLTKAKAQLPDKFDIEETLTRAAMLAKETSVVFRNFDPGDEKMNQGEVRFAEMPIAIEVCGSFLQTTAFFDRLVHLDRSVFVRGINMDATAATGCAGGTGPGLLPENAAETPIEQSQRLRRDLRIQTKAQLVLFRSTDGDPAPVPSAAPGNTPGNAPKAAPASSAKASEALSAPRAPGGRG